MRWTMVAVAIAVAGAAVQGQTLPSLRRVTAPLDESRRTVLTGNVSPELASANDLGPLPDATPVRRLQLMLSRSPEQQSALANLLDRQQDSNSPAFHQWLSPSQFAAQFGPSQDDLDAVVAWLSNHGFTGIQVNRSHTLVEFSGTAASVGAAFHTALHRYLVHGEERIANADDPSLPTALTPVVSGLVSLNNLPRQRASLSLGRVRRDNATRTLSPLAAASVDKPALTVPGTAPLYAITPYDFATIYDALPLWNAATPVDGTGQTIAVVGDTDLNPADFVNFRSVFGLPVGNTNTSTGTQYLNVIYNGANPGVRADEAQADIDTQWAAAVAKGAVIDYVASEDTEASLGVDLSAAYIVDSNLAGILTDSYSKCELALGAGGNAFYSALWQQAAAQGIAVVTASGDNGVAGCDAVDGAPATGGLAVSGIASTPYNVAVGGTDFYAPGGLSAYFSATNNTATLESAYGYIPEVAWNDSCANPLLSAQSSYLGMTPGQVCNSAAAQSSGLVAVQGGGGGASACTSSAGGSLASCSGGYAKPSWQTGTGVPSDGARDVPDVALFASKGRNGSFYVVCQQDLNADGKPCNAAAPYTEFAGYGGTGITAPAFAGALALVAQKTGGRLGNPNYVLYNLAAQQVAAATACNASGTVGGGCVFHDVTLGGNAMPCAASSPNCATANASGTVGVLASYKAGAGYDQATGLGSVDIANLANNWSTATFNSTTALLTVTPQSIPHGTAVAATVDVSATTGTPTGIVSLVATAQYAGLGDGPLVNGVYSATLRDLPGGAYGVRAHYAGDQTHAATDSNYVAVTVTPENSTVTLQALEIAPLTGAVTAGVASAPYGSVFYIRANVAGVSGQGVATGNVQIDDNGAIVGSGTFRLNSSGYTEAQVNSLSPGVNTFTASYTGDASFNPSAANSLAVTITAAPTTLTLTSNATSLLMTGTVTLTATVGTQSYGYYAPTGIVTFYSGSTALATTEILETNRTGAPDSAIAAITLPASAFAHGLNNITATYAGDARYLASNSGSFALTVVPTPLGSTVTAAVATPTTSLPGGTIAFSASVSGGTGAPTGTVQFIVDGQNTGAPITLSAGKAQLSDTIPSLTQLLLPNQTVLTPGTHLLTAVYSGNSTLGASVSAAASFVISIPSASSLPVLTIVPPVAVQGTLVSVQVQMTPKSPAPTGTAQLVLDGGLYGSSLPLTAGAVTLPLPTATLQTGTHVVSVYYAGDTTYLPSYAANASLTLTPPGETQSVVQLLNLPAQVHSGDSILFDAVVNPAYPAPTGILQLIVDGGSPGAPITLAGSNNALALSTAGLSLGTHTLSAYYSGDANYTFSTAPVVNFQVVAQAVAPGGTYALSPTSLVAYASLSGANPPGLTFTLTPSANFNHSVAFSCTGLPWGAQCVFSPATLPLIASPVSTVLTFNLSGLLAAAPAPRWPWLPGSGLVALAGALCISLRRRGRMLASLLACLSLAVLAGLAGCGQGIKAPVAGVGNYSVVVSATGGGVTQTATVSLTIQ